MTIAPLKTLPDHVQEAIATMILEELEDEHHTVYCTKASVFKNDTFVHVENDELGGTSLAQAIAAARTQVAKLVGGETVGGFMEITNHSLFALKLFATLGCGLMAGVFFAFSTFVMSALARLQPAQGIAAMQSLNITAINPLFMMALFGTAAACIFLAVSSLLKWHQPGAAYLLIGSLLYLVGSVGVTVAFNVPLNDALATVEPSSTDGANLWASYLTNWTAWNHIRTAAALAAAAALTIALCYRSVRS